MWLEVDTDESIIGVHSHECVSDDMWVETDELDVMPGDYWVDGKLKRNRPEKIELSEAEENEIIRRQAASKEIKLKYPEWKQINILRKGDDDEIKIMGGFIDSVRAWSNSPSLPADKINVVINQYFPKKNK